MGGLQKSGSLLLRCAQAMVIRQKVQSLRASLMSLHTLSSNQSEVRRILGFAPCHTRPWQPGITSPIPAWVRRTACKSLSKLPLKKLLKLRPQHTPQVCVRVRISSHLSGLQSHASVVEMIASPSPPCNTTRCPVGEIHWTCAGSSGKD